LPLQAYLLLTVSNMYPPQISLFSLDCVTIFSPAGYVSVNPGPPAVTAFKGKAFIPPFPMLC